ncbi:MAG: catalytic domain of component of various dehydrogenase complexe [Firmicutes bacterium]|nr:catalytic domain of component of various dehydrogenase complexe [Bacillota bacterium]
MTTNVAASKRGVAILVEVNMMAVTELKAELTKITGGNYSYTEFVIQCAAQALTEFKAVNASSVDGRIIEQDVVNIGVAISLTHGMVVPVIKNAQQKSLRAIRHDILNFAKKAHDGNLLPDDLSGGTFSVANLGMFGVDQFTPELPGGESASLGMCRIVKRPVAVNDEIVVQPMMNLCLSFDPAVIDGVTAAKFMARIRELMEQPLLLMA